MPIALELLGYQSDVFQPEVTIPYDLAVSTPLIVLWSGFTPPTDSAGNTVGGSSIIPLPFRVTDAIPAGDIVKCRTIPTAGPEQRTDYLAIWLVRNEIPTSPQGGVFDTYDKDGVGSEYVAAWAGFVDPEDPSASTIKMEIRGNRPTLPPSLAYAALVWNEPVFQVYTAGTDPAFPTATLPVASDVNSFGNELLLKGQSTVFNLVLGGWYVDGRFSQQVFWSTVAPPMYGPFFTDYIGSVPNVTVTARWYSYLYGSTSGGDPPVGDPTPFEGTNPSNVHFGPGGCFYGVAYTDGTSGYFKRAGHTSPPFERTAIAAPAYTSTVLDPVVREIGSRLHYVYSQGGQIKMVKSDDDGETWGVPVVVFSSGTRPVLAVDPTTGTALYACLSGTSIIGKIQNPGDTTLGAQFTFKDENGSNLSVQDTSFDISPSYDGTRRWLLTFRRSNAIQSYFSTDDGQTWTEIA